MRADYDAATTKDELASVLKAIKPWQVPAEA
jgi:hypothetical protein